MTERFLRCGVRLYNIDWIWSIELDKETRQATINFKHGGIRTGFISIDVKQEHHSSCYDNIVELFNSYPVKK